MGVKYNTMKKLSMCAVMLGLQFLLLCNGIQAVEINVSAAASLTDVLKEIAPTYEKQSGHKLNFNFGSSNMLARQIQEGAPADLFLSADEAKMDALEKAGFILAKTRVSLLSNELAVVVPSDSKLTVASMKDLADTKIKRLALSEPKTVPVGIYAREFLGKEGVWPQVLPKVIPTENVRASLAAVESGNVDAGIVYMTDALISKKVRLAYVLPADKGPKISYPVAITRECGALSATSDFLDYLKSKPVAEVFKKNGFIVLSQ